MRTMMVFNVPAASGVIHWAWCLTRGDTEPAFESVRFTPVGGTLAGPEVPASGFPNGVGGVYGPPVFQFSVRESALPAEAT